MCNTISFTLNQACSEHICIVIKIKLLYLYIVIKIKLLYMYIVIKIRLQYMYIVIKIKQTTEGQRSTKWWPGHGLTGLTGL